MRLFTADKETGIFIDEVTSIKEGLELIKKYEEEDEQIGVYVPDFYDIVNEDHVSVIK